MIRIFALSFVLSLNPNNSFVAQWTEQETSKLKVAGSNPVEATNMKVYKKDKKIIFEFSEEKKRFNPYDEDGDYGYHPTFIGLIDEDEFGNEEIGFAYTIDMDYKGKADQYTEIVIKYYEEVEDFIKLCKKLDIIVYDIRKKQGVV